MEVLGIVNQTRAFNRHVQPLLNAGLLERTVLDKPTGRLQRYQLTDAGRAYLSSQRDPVDRNDDK